MGIATGQIPEPLTLAEAQGWCNKPWCYADPCKCDAPDLVDSSAFKSHNLGAMKYTYSACGSIDEFTATKTDNTVGGGNCEVETAGASAFGSLRMLMSFLAVGALSRILTA